jgi:hypothetical protein
MGREAHKDGWRTLVVVNFTLTLLSAVMEYLAGKPFLRAQLASSPRDSLTFNLFPLVKGIFPTLGECKFVKLDNQCEQERCKA